MAKNRNTPIWDEVRGNIKGVKNEVIIMNASMVILGILMVMFPNAINGLICQGIGGKGRECVWFIWACAGRCHAWIWHIFPCQSKLLCEYDRHDTCNNLACNGDNKSAVCI